jgi:hypothetical protein
MATTLLLAAVTAARDAAVPRKKRGPPRVRAETSRWWSFSLPVPPPPPTAASTPGKCGDCKATQTSRWRTGPKGRRTLCDTCGRRRWEKGERWGDPRRRRQETPTTPLTTVSDQPPPQPQPPPPAAEYGPVFVEGPLPEGYRAARKNAAAKRRSPSPSPAPDETATTTDYSDKPAAPQIKKRKKYKHKARADKQCVHCGSSETPQWREGPEGRGTLCNACGVRHRQKRLLPEYRPQASPAFDKENHASLHSEVLALRQQKPQPMDDSQQQVVDPIPPPPPPPLPPRCMASDLRVGATGSTSANNASSSVAAGPSTVPAVREVSYYLHPFLLNGPAAPMIVDEPYWMAAGPPRSMINRAFQVISHRLICVFVCVCVCHLQTFVDPCYPPGVTYLR